MLRRTELLMKDWYFTGPDNKRIKINLPHTWNNKDGQDGGNDYYRGSCCYEKQIVCPLFDRETERVYLEFEGVNCSSNVLLNGESICVHDNGYSTFRTEVTDLLKDVNLLKVIVDNGINDRVYPQKADFTFYGGIYRDVKLITVSKNHFDMDYYGGPGIKVSTSVAEGKGSVRVETFVDKHVDEGEFTVRTELLDDRGNVVASSVDGVVQHKTDVSLHVDEPHLWDGVNDPYLYRVHACLMCGSSICDEIETTCGIRTFCINQTSGFYLNGKKYPLHGVSRHQDRRDLGNAITYEMMDEDMALIRELGANTIRLAHYQHSQYFYDLCDKYGLVVWAEIPYISAQLPNGDSNTQLQMTELIVQNYNHPSIVTWGISNEITISPLHKKQMINNHHRLQALCKSLDPDRPTTMACYAMCSPFNGVTKITDLINWNLYLGWYVPILALNDVLMPLYHMLHPNQPFGYSEYGAEGMPNLHSSRPRRGDHTEEYQCKYHEYMLHCFERHPYVWATYVWNMFDFAADARNQGGEPGMNHKGLVTFDRKTRKDSFYVYKAFWSQEPFVHICGKRYEYRLEKYSDLKVYTNQKYVAVYVDGKKIATAQGKRIYKFLIPINKKTFVQVYAGDDLSRMECVDEATFYKTNIFLEQYKLIAKKSDNWV